MKFKTWAALAAAGLLIASVSYADPSNQPSIPGDSIAAPDNGANAAAQQLAQADTGGLQGPDLSGIPNQNITTAQNDPQTQSIPSSTDSPQQNMPANNGNSNANEGTSADTPNGDDDY